MEKEYKFIKCFGPSYLCKNTENIVETLNNYIDKIIKDKKKKRIRSWKIFSW